MLRDRVGKPSKYYADSSWPLYVIFLPLGCGVGQNLKWGEFITYCQASEGQRISLWSALRQKCMGRLLFLCSSLGKRE
jgi:hypothetical protein